MPDEQPDKPDWYTDDKRTPDWFRQEHPDLPEATTAPKKPTYDIKHGKAGKSKPLLPRLLKPFGFLKNVFLRTALVCAIGGTTTGMLSYSHENNRSKLIPLGFSEIHQIEDDAETVDSLGHYLASTNDASMKVFECWNDANKTSGNKYQNFALELAKRLDPDNKAHHYNLADLLELVPKRAQKAYSHIGVLARLSKNLPGINDSLASAWVDSHSDNYRTETYVTTETYSDGKDTKTRMVTKTRQVYVNTSHSYRYSKQHGENANIRLANLLKSVKTSELYLEKGIKTASETHEEGKKAAIESRKKKGKEVNLSENQLTDIANTWRSGSTVVQNTMKIRPHYGKLVKHAGQWKTAKNTAQTDFYNTTSRSDSGPQEFQIVESALQNGQTLSGLANEALESITLTQDQAPKLRQDIDDLVTAAQNGSSCKKLGKKVLSGAQEMYERNFSAGFDVTPFRLYMLALFITGGILVPAAGSVVPYLISNRRKNNYR
jgi:hypothetical protein